MENHVIVTTGTVKKWRNADPQWYYGAGYIDVTIKAFKCSNCGKYIGQYKLLYGNHCPNCGEEFEGYKGGLFSYSWYSPIHFEDDGWLCCDNSLVKYIHQDDLTEDLITYLR